MGRGKGAEGENLGVCDGGMSGVKRFSFEELSTLLISASFAISPRLTDEDGCLVGRHVWTLEARGRQTCGVARRSMK